MPVGDEAVEANAPLIAQGLSEDGDQIEPRQKAQPGPHRLNIGNAGRVIWILTFSAGISGLLFGYDTGVISSTLVSIGSDLSGRELTTTDKTSITAITSLFALISSPTTGYFADRYGRRFVILVASILFIVGAMVQAVANYVWLMVVGRAVVGAAVGLASCGTPLYIAEVAPAELRGRLVTIQSLFITGGQVVAYVVGWQLASLPAGWRWMVGLGAAPAIGQAFLLTLMYETPRWLVKNEKESRARMVLHKIYGSLKESEREAAVDNVLHDIRVEIAAEAELDDDEDDLGPESAWTTFKSTLFHLSTHLPYRRALWIACLLQGFQQLCAFNALMYFSATIFELVGFENPIGVSLSIAGTNFIFTIAAFAFIDTVGRRNILLRSIPFMILGLGACSFAFHFVDYVLVGDSTVVLEQSGNFWPVVLVTAMIVYVAAYAIGLGCVPWQQAELFPLQVRSVGSGLATATNWTCNYVLGVTFLPMMNEVGATATFAVYAVICVVGWAAVFRIYPETAGLELEEVGELLKDGFGVKESVQRFKAGKKKVARDASSSPTDDNEDE